MAALGVVFVALALPARGVAAEEPTVSAFSLESSNGYKIWVIAVPPYRGERETVLIRVWNERAGAGAFYLTRAVTVTNTSVRAYLGDLGEIDVTFRPSGVMRPVRSNCGGETEPVESGTYEGTIIFHGEEGYTAVEASTAPADFGLLIDMICPDFGSEGQGGNVPGAKLVAHAGFAGDRTQFEVVKNRPSERARFAVSVGERRGQMAITRGISLVAPRGSFLYGPDMRTATVRPPAPFAGSASFHREAKPANRWRGNLTVDFPGRSNVSLTGGQERANIRRAAVEWPPSRRDRGHSAHGSSLAFGEHPPASARAGGRG